MPFFRKKPVVIEAVRIIPPSLERPVGNHTEVVDHFCATARVHPRGFTIPTLEGDMVADFGDWIIRGVKGEFYPCKPDIFAATYEPASGPGEREGERAPRNHNPWRCSRCGFAFPGPPPDGVVTVRCPSCRGHAFPEAPPPRTETEPAPSICLGCSLYEPPDRCGHWLNTTTPIASLHCLGFVARAPGGDAKEGT
jgi:hypothetical protein